MPKETCKFTKDYPLELIRSQFFVTAVDDLCIVLTATPEDIRVLKNLQQNFGNWYVWHWRLTTDYNYTMVFKDYRKISFGEAIAKFGRF